jgi:hypothetical protein
MKFKVGVFTVPSRFLKDKRGIATITAVAMAFIIIMLLMGGTILWQGMAQSQKNVIDKDRMDEGVIVQAAFSYNEVSEDYDVEILAKNNGTVEVELIQVWVIDDENNDHQHVDVSYGIRPGGHTSLTESEVDELLSKLSNPLDVWSSAYYFKVVTARGSIFISRMVPEEALYTDDPILILPWESYVKKQGNYGEIHLEVWSRLTEELLVTSVIATSIESGATKIEEIEADWILAPQEISVDDFTGEDSQVYKKDELVKIELVSANGIVVSSFYFTVL